MAIQADTTKQKRAVLHAVPKLCQSDGSFTSSQVAMQAGDVDKVQTHTVRRALNTAGYHYCRSRKKGLLRSADLNARLPLCKTICKRKLGQSVTFGYRHYTDTIQTLQQLYTDTTENLLHKPTNR